MTTRTAAERLALVRAAIDDILIGGQSVSYNGRSVTMANLPALRDLERAYLIEANREAAAAAGITSGSRAIFVEIG